MVAANVMFPIVAFLVWVGMKFLLVASEELEKEEKLNSDDATSGLLESTCIRFPIALCFDERPTADFPGSNCTRVSSRFAAAFSPCQQMRKER